MPTLTGTNLYPWVEVILTDVADEVRIERWSEIAMADVPADPNLLQLRLQSVGRFIRALSDRAGELEAQGGSFTAIDHDRYLLQLLNTQWQYWLNRVATVYLKTEAHRYLSPPASKGEPLFRGLIRSWPQAQRTFEFELEDYLTSPGGPIPIEGLMPKRTIDKYYFPDAPDGVVGWPEPICYGFLGERAGGLGQEMSDHPETGTVPIPGCVPTVWVGTEMIPNEGEPTGPTWIRMLVCGHAVRGIWRVWLLEQPEPPPVPEETDVEPAITSQDEITFGVGVDGTFEVRVTGSPEPSVTRSGDLPAGVSFSGKTLQGIPETGTIGTYALTFTASNEVGTPATQSFTLYVATEPGDPQPPVPEPEPAPPPEPPVFVDVTTTRLGVDILVPPQYPTAIPNYTPGPTYWPFATRYRDINGRRYTLLYAIGPLANQIAAGTAFIRVDLIGVETEDGTEIGGDADGNGVEIHQAIAAYRHWMINFVYGDWQSGPWLGEPMWPGTSEPLMDLASFNTVGSWLSLNWPRDPADLVPPTTAAGVIGALGERLPLRDWLARWNLSLCTRCGFNRKGQFMIAILHIQVSGSDEDPPLIYVTPAMSFDSRNRLDDTFQQNIDPRGLRNVLPCHYQRNYATSQWTWEELISINDWSINRYREAVAEAPREFWFIREYFNAQTAINYYSMLTAVPPKVVAWDTTLDASLLELGDLVHVTTDDAPGTGWVDRRIWIERIETEPDTGVVRVEGIDATSYEDAIIGGVGLASLDEVRYLGPHPPAAETGSAAPSAPAGSGGGGGGGGGGAGLPGPPGPPGAVYLIANLGGSRMTGVSGAGPIPVTDWVPIILDSTKITTLMAQVEITRFAGPGTVTPRITRHVSGLTWVLVDSGEARAPALGVADYQQFPVDIVTGSIAYRLELVMSDATTVATAIGTLTAT